MERRSLNKNFYGTLTEQRARLTKKCHDMVQLLGYIGMYFGFNSMVLFLMFDLNLVMLVLVEKMMYVKAGKAWLISLINARSKLS